MAEKGTFIGEFDFHLTLRLDDGRLVQVPKHQTVHLGADRYAINEGAKYHTFPKESAAA